MKKERHHIVPRHMGGTDEENNIEYITVAEHADRHRILFEQYGHKWDYLAWKGRTGHIGREEINHIKWKEAGRKGGLRSAELGVHLGRKRSAETKQKMSDNHANMAGDKNPMYGKKHSAETRKKISEAAKRRWRKT